MTNADTATRRYIVAMLALGIASWVCAIVLAKLYSPVAYGVLGTFANLDVGGWAALGGFSGVLILAAASARRGGGPLGPLPWSNQRDFPLLATLLVIGIGWNAYACLASLRYQNLQFQFLAIPVSQMLFVLGTFFVCLAATANGRARTPRS